MHTLFTLEDNYGIKISEIDGEVCLKVAVSQLITRPTESLPLTAKSLVHLKKCRISKRHSDISE